jgi:shikimate dehydrogenase
MSGDQTLSSSTRLAAVIGHPIGHSLSPVLHNAAFRALGIDWAYLAFDVNEPAVPRALDAMRVLGIDGLSVTMPDKEAVARHVDRLEPDAEALAAVNCVSREGDVLIGHNTDGQGFIDSLRLDQGFEPEGRTCGVIGAGGAARAVIRSLAGVGAAEVAVVNRSPERGEQAARLAGTRGRLATAAELEGVELVVNATPAGMGGSAELPLDPEVLQPGQLVIDLVYHPLETPLVVAARERGARAANGVGMLVHQAGHQLRIWTGLEPPLAALRAAVTEAVSESEASESPEY